MAGFYELGDLNVPVFDHTREIWGELITAELSRRPTGVRTAVDLFDHLPVPRPVKADVAAVVEFVRSQEVEPSFVEARTTLSIRKIARDLVSAGALTEADKVSRLHGTYESSLARSEYYSFQAFWEAVQQQILGLALPGAGPADPEGIPLCRARSPLRRIGKRAHREIEPLLRAAAGRGRSLMMQFGEADYARRLAPDLLPDVQWTRRPVRAAFAWWSPRISGQAKGKPIIRVNVILRAPLTQVSDDMLEYLLWHELCHQLLPGRGHDAEFRWLQSIWPDNARLDHDLDTLQERYDLGWNQN